MRGANASIHPRFIIISVLKGGDQVPRGPSTGYEFGVTKNQAKAAIMMANDKTNEEIYEEIFGVTALSSYGDKQRAAKTLNRWKKLNGFQECFRAEVRNMGMPIISKAIQRLVRQLDSENEWIVNKAANDLISKYMPHVMGEDSNEVVIRVEGMPEIGIPEQDELIVVDEPVGLPGDTE